MPRSATLLACSLLLGAAPGWSLPAKIVAFGDSITYGDFDIPDGYGYPGRLDVRLGNAGWNTEVVNKGKNGESTSGALSRVGGVVAEGGEFFLLMEGTNDISARTSVETIVFNLDQIAGQAAGAGFKVVHASVIPRKPCTERDASNTKTGNLADQVESLAASKNRSFVAVYDYFLSLPNLFANYYHNYNPDCVTTSDPGHPNQQGYGKLTDPFESKMNALLAAGAAIQPPGSPVAGAIVSFNASLFRSDYTQLEWDFGDGGKVTVVPSGGSAPPASWIFTEPGSYKVRLTWTRTNASTGTVTKTITVGGSTPAWSRRISVVPLAFRGDGAAPDDLRFDLTLGNYNGSSRIAEVRYLDESVDGSPIPLLDLGVEPIDAGLDVGETISGLREQVPPEHYPRRRWLLPTGTSLPVGDLLGDELGVGAAHGAALVTFFYTSGSEASFFTDGELYGAGHPTLGSPVDEVEDQSWSASARDLTGLEPSADKTVRVAITNLGDGDAIFHLTLHDGIDDEKATADLVVLKSSTETAALDELFPDLASYSGPFRLAIDAAAQPFAAAAATVDATTGSVDAVASTP